MWTDLIRAGNLYINRGTTGAIVDRQPFGGVGKSAIGPGVKAGGPNYVVSLMQIEDNNPAEHELEAVEDKHVRSLLQALKKANACTEDEVARLASAAVDYEAAMKDEFSKRHDHAKLVGQDNFRLYRPVEFLRIRVAQEDSWFDAIARICAAKIAGCRATVSFVDAHSERAGVLHDLTESWAGAIEFLEESDEELADAITSGQTDRVRYGDHSRVSDAVRRAAAQAGVHVEDAPVLAAGRIELLRYLYEQSLCVNYHRYGNLGARAGERRRPVL